MVVRAATQSTAEMVTAIGFSDMAVGEGMMGRVMATKKPLVSENIAEGEWIPPEFRLESQERGIRSGASVPLLANDKSLGVLAVMDKQIRRFTDDEVSLLSAFADQASLALEKARLLTDITYLPMARGFLYLVSIMDWHSRYVVAWRLSNSLEADFCVDAPQGIRITTLSHVGNTTLAVYQSSNASRSRQ